MASRIVLSLAFTLILSPLTSSSSKENRQKRDVSDSQPRILTQNGHMIFQTGVNHNITFRSTNGGSINIGDENLGTIVSIVKDTQNRVQQLQSEGGSSVREDLQRLQNQLDSLDISPGSLQSLRDSLDSITSRVTTLETSTSTPAPSGDVDTNRQLTEKVRDLTSQIQSINRTIRRVQRNECDRNVCQHGGTCIDLVGDHLCLCTSGWQGVNCETDINECSTLAGTDKGCQNGATCQNNLGGYSCQCAPNWYGVLCTIQNNDCSGGSNAMMCGHGTCHDEPRQQQGMPNFRCDCDPGWTHGSNSPACELDVNECEDPQYPCSIEPHVDCENTAGSFRCRDCPDGYTGNGYHCSNINECEQNNGGCFPGVICTDTRGSRSCGSCPDGYIGDGVNCHHIGLCNIDNGGCSPFASCTVNNAQGFNVAVCTCRPGYSGNGVGANGCAADSGPSQTTGPCFNNPCVHGRCHVTGNTYVCVCDAGWIGTNCNQASTSNNPCSPNPCRHGGTCRISGQTFACACTNSYSGPTCETVLQSKDVVMCWKACGGRLSGNSGTFSYPVETGENYNHNVSCAWVITVQEGKIVQLHFEEFKLEYHANCVYDFLQIHDGPSAGSHLIGRFCGQTLPLGGNINSTHNQVYFWFKSDSSVSHEGFTITWNAINPTCGGILRGQDYGVIRSPGYPGNYPHNRDCTWNIIVSPGNLVAFTFGEIAMENHANCSYDYIKVYGGIGELASDELLTVCGGMPAPLVTNSHAATVVFHSDESRSDRGFSINYHTTPAYPGCGGELTATSGTLISPNYPNNYPPNVECVWTITVPDTEVITFNFTNIDLEVHSNCRWDYIEVREGSDETGAFVGRYCQSTLPPPYTSTGPSLLVKFRTDSSNQHSGFRAVWDVVCGGTFNEPTGELRSPFFPNPYPNNKECIYTIQQPAGRIITLTFVTFDVEASSGTGCNYDYLEVRNGASETGDLINRYCGTALPDPITSSSNNLWLKFGTDASQQNHGFRATYVTTQAVEPTPGPDGSENESGCGGTISGLTGAIHSPSHPTNYPHNSDCTWFLSAPEGYILRLTFHQFELESHRRCNYDSVQVFDNNTIQGQSLGKFCGYQVPSPVLSTGRFLTVRFRSDGSVTRTGFRASFIALDASSICGRRLTAESGVITSPNYPQNYEANRDCTWTIVVRRGHQITLNVTDFEMQGTPICTSDYLRIRNGGSITSPLIGTYCGTTIDNIIRSHSNRLYLRMKTNSYSNFRGFSISYYTTQSGCGGEMTTPTGSFVSPNFPEAYHNSAQCYWTIRVSAGSKITLIFSHMDLENHPNCNYDYVEIRKGTRNGEVLQKSCGNTLPQPLTADTNQLFVTFRTDGSATFTGFSASYHADCNNEITTNTGVIESPSFPEPYPTNRDCTWIIRVPRGNTINASFSHFNLEQSSQCSDDYLEIRDGEDTNGALITKACGETLPDNIATTAGNLYLRFVSNNYISATGFRMEYVTHGCGGRLTAASGNFTSPNYPEHYPPTQCDWHIETTPGTRIQLNITDIDFETQTTNCPYDKLTIYAGFDETSNVLQTLCQPLTNTLVTMSTGNNMFLRFSADHGIAGRGFAAQYRAVPGGCGGYYSALSGFIATKDFPSQYDHNTHCVWNITVPEGRAIKLTFLDFDVESHSACRYDWVQVLNGPELNSTQLSGRLCGRTLPTNRTFVSTSNHLIVRMRTDYSVAGRGFRAAYNLTCGGMITAHEDGEITSPGWPNYYESPSNCSWTILAPQPDMKVTLTFTYIDIYGNETHCPFDSVQVFAGDDASSPLVGTYCGNTVPAAYTSYGSALTVTFTALGRTRPAHGFRAVYSSSTSSCGGDFTAEHGAFNSPGYPEPYGADLECVWTVSKPPGNHLLLSFSLFNIESDPFCNNDFVEVRQGDSGGQLMGRFCGNDIPSNITVLENLWVKFRTNAEIPGIGFNAIFNAVYSNRITGTSGAIATPQYPRPYPASVDYDWIVTAPVDAQIRIEFTNMDIEQHIRCVFDYIDVYDGESDNARRIGRYCGRNNPPVIYSTSNVVRFLFHTDGSVTGQGFYLRWNAVAATLPTTPGPSAEPPCGEALTAGSSIQTLTSPGYPHGYDDGLNCEWVITAPPYQRVWLNITYMSLESPCYYDRLTFNDIDRTQATYCGIMRNSEPILSVGNTITLVFSTDYSVNRTGFAVDYKSVCGGRVDLAVGRLQSPGYPGDYPTNTDCEWSVEVTRGRTVSLNFEAFDIQGTRGQCFPGDYLEFSNGIDENAPPLTERNSNTSRHCGSRAPNLPETTDNGLKIRFKSDAHGTAGGFALTFAEVPFACGGSLYLTEDYNIANLTSPNYTQTYPPNVDCEWVISAPGSRRIRMDFVDQFEIESHPDCDYDFVELRDGGTVHSPLIGRYCTERPHTLRTSGNVLYVRFRTDDSIPRRGFKLMYQIDTCGGTIIGSEGTITSPNFPNSYPSNSDCEWFVEGPVGHYLTFQVQPGSSIQYARRCLRKDYVQVRDYNATGPVLSTFCGTSRPTIDTSDNTAHIRFVSDSSQHYRGFRMTFTASVEACGGSLTTNSGTFTSPNYPGLYAHRRTCHWQITVAQGRRIRLTFNDLDIEDHSRCTYDYVAAYNGILQSSPFLIRLCGSETPTDAIESSGNTMAVVFRTDGSVSGRGFSASYTSNTAAVCGGLFTNANGLTGTISSPGFSSNVNYNASTECLWTIENTDAYDASIALQFTRLDMEHHGDCHYDFVELREGGQLGYDLGKFCSNMSGVPAVIATPDTLVWIRFVSDHVIHGRGFELQYSYHRCGGILSEPEGTIISPNYPGNYNNSLICAWKIIAPEGARIKMTMNYFAMEESTNCTKDYLDIFNGPMKSSPLYGRFCGGQRPRSVFLAQSNVVRLEFFSDAEVTDPGFSFNYEFLTSACGGDIHASSGHIASPNWPQRYPPNADCRWTVTNEPGYHFLINWNAPFEFPITSPCAYNQDYVAIIDVLSNGQTERIGRYCGNESPGPLQSKTNVIKVNFRSNAGNNYNGFSFNFTSGCGGEFTGAEGSIASPGHPGQYGNNLNCTYIIRAENPQDYVVLNFSRDFFAVEGVESIRRIRERNYKPLNSSEDSGRETVQSRLFFQFDAAGIMAAHPGIWIPTYNAYRMCPYDYIMVYEGSVTESRRHGPFCGQYAPGVITSQGMLTVKFITDGQVTDAGWIGNYFVSECGGVFTGDNGTIRSPAHPMNYMHNADCTYTITVPENRIVVLRFTEFHLERNHICAYDYIKIYDGSSTNDTLLGMFCGTDIPPSVRTTGNTMTVNFVSDFSVSHGGFVAAYGTSIGPEQGCGGIVNVSQTGMVQVQSPDIDNDGNYEAMIDCVWRLMAPPNYQVKVIMTRFNTFPGINGTGADSLVIRDGMFDTDPVIGTLSGNIEVPPSFIALDDAVVLRFRTTTADYPGFSANVTAIPRVCGGSYTASNVTQTLSLAGNYNPDTRCRWNLDSPEGTAIFVKTQSMFINSSEADCTDAYVLMADVPTTELSRLHHYCRNVTVPQFKSHGNNMRISLVTGPRPGSSFSFDFNIASCNQTYTEPTGRIVSPGFPGLYPHNIYCEMRIQVAEGRSLTLYFNTMVIETHSSCNYDYLQVINGTQENATTLGTFCQRILPPPIFTTSSSLLLKFATDSSVQHPGFDITYVSNNNDCGGNLTGTYGFFASPGYPSGTDQNISCTWRIQVPARRRLDFNIVSMDVGRPASPYDCNSNYLQIFDGTDMNGTPFGTYCGSTPPAEIIATGSTLTVNFVNSGVNSGNGFSASYTSTMR